MLKQSTLTSIPERNEVEEESRQKWVPKKKHEVLKAKYKCLKKLFQIYDASNNSTFLPEPIEYIEETKTRRKRSHRTKTDACAGTNEQPSGDITQTEPQFDCFNESSTTINEIHDVKLNFDTKSSAQIEIPKENLESNASKYKMNASKFEITVSKSEMNASKFEMNASKSEMNASLDVSRYDKFAESKDDLSRKASLLQYKCDLSSPHPLPYLVQNERRKLTRFQCFVQRIFGLRRDTHMLANGAHLTASDSQRERWRKRGLRFRRIRRIKKIKSETDIYSMKSPAIISYVQSVQRNCLADTTPRQCPILGCRMMSYGIINYNDHLNLCHFKNRKFICHYCHEGFEKAYDKYVHESEHLGLPKLNPDLRNVSDRNNSSNSNTQTDPELRIPEDKLKKIVSFFDKINDHEEIITEIRKRSSETNLTNEVESNTESQNSSDKRTVSCVNIHKSICKSSNSSVTSQAGTLPDPCLYCAKSFEYSGQLCCHSDLEHKVPKFLKSYSCHDQRQRDLRQSRASQDLYEESLPGTQRYFYGRPRSPRDVYEETRPRRDLYEETRPQRNLYEETRPQRDLYDTCSRRQELISEDGRLNILSIESSTENRTYSEVTSPSPSDETITQGKYEKSLSCDCDPSTNIVFSSMESVKKPSVVETLLKKVRSYRWEPNTKIIHV